MCLSWFLDIPGAVVSINCFFFPILIVYLITGVIKGYIPTSYEIRNGAVSFKAGRYYVSVLIDMPDIQPVRSGNPGIGIDLGVKDLAILSDGKVYKNINKTAKVRKLEKQLKRAQKCLSRKYENKKKGEAAQYKNIILSSMKYVRIFR